MSGEGQWGVLPGSSLISVKMAPTAPPAASRQPPSIRESMRGTERAAGGGGGGGGGYSVHLDPLHQSKGCGGATGSQRVLN